MSDPNATRQRRRATRPPWRKGLLALAGAVLTVTVAGCTPGGGEAASGPQSLTDPAVPGSLTEQDVNGWLDGLLPAALEESGVAGATVSVVNDGEVLTARGYGYAETGNSGNAPVDVDPQQTLFRPGSVSKLFTATAAMQLVERGELDLDADIAPHLDYELPLQFDTELTMRHLLTHTAGFEERIAGLIGTGDSPVSLRESLVTDPPEQVFEPGTTPAYSNYGYALAGYIVERISGVSFEDYVQQEILDRTGMESSSFHQPLPDDLRARMSHGYADVSGQPQPFEMIGQSPAGALSAPATDMAQFMLAQLGELPADQSPLSEQTLELLQSPALDASTLGNLAEGRQMTLGFFQEDRNGHRIVGHGGDTTLFHSHLQIYPDQGAGIFISLNSSGTNGTETLQLRQSVLDGFADRYFPGPESPAGTVDQQTMREHAEAAEGTYVSARGFHSTFLTVVALLDQTSVTALEDGKLRLEPGSGGRESAEYEEISPWVWREVGGHHVIAMRVDDGAVTAIGHEPAFTLLPLEPQRSLALPILAFSVVILVLTLIAWPAGALLRRLLKRRGSPVPGRRERLLTRIGVACTLSALVGWVLVVLTLMELQEVPGAALRFLQVLQLAGVAALVPAGMRVVSDLRHRTGWLRVVAGALVFLALAGTAWFAFEFQLLAPSISY